jgi:predicted DNA-binding transcriptional regulator
VSEGITIAEAAEQLGITPAAARQRLYSGTLKGRKLKKGWIVYLNGNEPVPEMKKIEEGNDPITEIADEMISLGRRLKKAMKEHDAEVRRDTIVDFAATLAETAKRR